MLTFIIWALAYICAGCGILIATMALVTNARCTNPFPIVLGWPLFLAFFGCMYAIAGTLIGAAYAVDWLTRTYANVVRKLRPIWRPSLR